MRMSLSFADLGGSGNHFFGFLLTDGLAENIATFDGRLLPEEDDFLGVAKCNMPLGIEQEGLRYCARRGYKNRFHLPTIKNVLPAGVDVNDGLD
jgi:hypothetical protein